MLPIAPISISSLSGSRVDQLVFPLVLLCTLRIIPVPLSTCASIRVALQAFAPIQVSHIEVALVLFGACDGYVSSGALGIEFQLVTVRISMKSVKFWATNEVF